MPEYESPEKQREIEYRKRYETNRFVEPLPNRRGDYDRAPLSRELCEPGTSWMRTRQWRYQSRDTGQRSLRRWNRQRAADTRGFQHEFVPIEKPKVPGRVLRAAQEDDLWYEEFYEGSQARQDTD